MGIRSTKRPINSIWGKIQLFHENFSLTHTRTEFEESGIFIKVKQQIIA